MPLFTFYPCRSDGSSLAFETFELEDDDQALARAQAVLREHGSAVHVIVWQGERCLGPVARIADPA